MSPKATFRVYGFIVLILCGAIRILVADGEMEGESGSGEDGLQLRLMNTSGVDPNRSSRTGEHNNTDPDLSRCISVSDAIRDSLIFNVCIKYFPSDKLFIYNYGADYGELKKDLELLNAALKASSSTSPYCMDITRAYTCNYVYPGCSNVSGLPREICKDECERYVLDDTCRTEFRTFEQVTDTIGRLTFTRQCNDTLLILQDYGTDTESIEHSDCYDITETLTVDMIDNSVEPKATTTTEGTSSSTDLSQLLAIVLSTISVLLLSILAVTVIFVNIWKANRKTVNPFESQTITNNYHSSWLEGNEYDKSATQGLFQLSEEDVHAFWKDDKLREAIVPMDSLYLTGELGEGAFGRVFKGLLVTEDPAEEGGRTITQIAIKTVKNAQGMYRELKAFIEESVLMCSFNHPHVLGMVGICLDTVQSPYLLLPYMANGDLRTFLRNKRDTDKSSDIGYPEGLDYSVLVRMCYEVASGMEYLASNKLVHRDLAARNCMVDEDLTIKVADFGLARVIYHTDYYRQHQQTKVPVKWMAPESLHDMISTEKSDAWSYGVVCWEVFSLGRLPYPTLANHEVVDYLERGNRLKKPALCTDILYKLMLNCWEREADQRPTFTKLVSQFHDTILPGTPGADNGGTYVLLGPEEDKNLLARAKSLHETSVLDITIVSRQHVTPPVSDGMTFDVVFLSPGGTERMHPVSEKVDSDCYMDMSSVSHEGSVIVNPGAEFNEYDNVTADCQESGDDGHMTTDSGHVTTTRADHVTHSNRSNGIHEHNEYILMHSAGPVVPNSQK